MRGIHCLHLFCISILHEVHILVVSLLLVLLFEFLRRSILAYHYLVLNNNKYDNKFYLSIPTHILFFLFHHNRRSNIFSNGYNHMDHIYKYLLFVYHIFLLLVYVVLIVKTYVTLRKIFFYNLVWRFKV